MLIEEKIRRGRKGEERDRVKEDERKNNNNNKSKK